jgi:hypothetical protein
MPGSARRPPSEEQEEGRAEQHAQREQRHGVHAVAIRELDDDALAGERDGGDGHQQRPGEARLSLRGVQR